MSVSLVEELHDPEAALVHVEMNVALLEVWGNQSPHFSLRILLLDSSPYLLAQSPAVLLWIYV